MGKVLFLIFTVTFLSFEVSAGDKTIDNFLLGQSFRLAHSVRQGFVTIKIEPSIFLSPSHNAQAETLPIGSLVKVEGNVKNGFVQVSLSDNLKTKLGDGPYFALVEDLQLSLLLYTTDKDVDIFEKESGSQVGQMKGNAPFEAFSVVEKNDKIFIYGEPIFQIVNAPIPFSATFDREFLINLDDLKIPDESLVKNRVFAESVKVLPLGNDHVAIDVVLTLEVTNETYIVDFYKNVFAINKANENEKVNIVLLAPQILKSHLLSGAVNSSEAQQELMKISKESVSIIKNEIEAFQSENEQDEKFFPGLTFLEVENTAHPWTQDITQQIYLPETNEIGFIDIHAYREGSGLINPSIKSLVDFYDNAKVVDFGQSALFKGSFGFDEGGNIEVSPENKFIVGNNFPEPFLNKLRDKILGTITLPNDFLQVAHVDLVYSIVPAENECGSAIFVNSPLELIKLKLQKADQVADVFSSIKLSGIEYFLKEKPDNLNNLSIEHFDLKKPHQNNWNYFITLQNLKAQARINEGVETLKKSMKFCDWKENESLIYLPQAFTVEVYEEPENFEEYTSSLVPEFYFLNWVALNKHLIVPSGTTILDNYVKKKVESIIGSGRVHFINAGLYQINAGGAHCSSLVIRGLDKIK